MQIGFAMLESGFCRAKKPINIHCKKQMEKNRKVLISGSTECTLTRRSNRKLPNSRFLDGVWMMSLQSCLSFLGQISPEVPVPGLLFCFRKSSHKRSAHTEDKCRACQKAEEYSKPKGKGIINPFHTLCPR